MKDHVMTLRPLALTFLLAMAASPLAAETVRGTGRAQITKDVETVRNQAESAARRAIVVQLLEASLGADRVNEVPPATIDALASQLRADMITGRTSRREQQTFIVDLDADVDSAWFRTLLDNKGIQSSSQRAMGDGQLIFVMLDQTSGVASDFAKPAETTVEYDRQTGGSFSDRSAETASSKDASAAASRSAGAFRTQEASAYRTNAKGAYGATGASSTAIRTPDGAAAGQSRGSVASRFSGSAAGAHSASAAGGYSANSQRAESHSASYANRTNVQAEVHDNTRYREHVVYQRPPANSPAGYALSALTQNLGQYGVAMADPDQALSSFFAGSPPRFEALARSERFTPFLTSLAQKRAPFFMGGTITVEHGGRDPATNAATCSGRLNARAFATADSRMIASGAATAASSGSTPGECEGKLADALARGAAGQIGPKVQNYWRNSAAVRAAAGQDTRQAADYALSLRATSLDMAMQADILDALQATPGVEAQNFVSQAGNEMRFTVRYAGTVPLQLALYQKLRSRPAFSAMQSTANGRSILLCLSGCGTPQ